MGKPVTILLIAVFASGATLGGECVQFCLRLAETAPAHHGAAAATPHAHHGHHTDVPSFADSNPIRSCPQLALMQATSAVRTASLGSPVLVATGLHCVSDLPLHVQLEAAPTVSPPGLSLQTPAPLRI